jgi:hypothetical protein
LFVSTLTGCSLFGDGKQKPVFTENIQLRNQNEWEKEVYVKIRVVREGVEGLGIVIPKAFHPLTTYNGPSFSFQLPERMELKERLGDKQSFVGRLYFFDRERAFDLDLFWLGGFVPERLYGKITAGTDMLLLKRLDELYASPGGKAFHETELAEQFAAWQRETGPKIMVSRLGGWTEGETGEVTFARFYLVRQRGIPTMGFAISWYSGTPESGKVFVLVCRSGWEPVEITPEKVMWPPLKKDPTFSLATLVLGSFREGKN